MAKRSDAITRWWRGISLRSKVTGVTVAVLAVGLFATGIGAMLFLRNALVVNLDASLVQLVQTDATTGLLITEPVDGGIDFSVNPDAPQTDYFVAVYEPKNGDFVVSAGGRGGPEPDFPANITLEYVTVNGTEPFPLEDAETGAQFHASVDALPVDGTSALYIQLVALPLAQVDRVVTTYLGIFGILALITIVAGALLTRWLVTLTFRGLGQVESTAMSIAAGDFSQRLTDIEPGTEVGRLKSAINTMLNRVDASISQRDSSVRQMRRFIGDASHELRTPLVTVRGYAELYRMGAITGDEDTAKAMDRIEKEAVRMGALVEDLLALARLDERRDLEFTPVDLRPIARDAALDVRASSPQRPVTVIDSTIPLDGPGADAMGPAPAEAEPESPTPAPRRRGGAPTSAISLAGATLGLLRRKPRPVPASRATTSADAGASVPPVTPIDLPGATTARIVETPPIVSGDENRIRQVVANLLGNARRYTPEESAIDITVGVDATARTGWIAVIDHGEGIPEQVRNQIFERFWRADTSRARETGGSGLGLSIVASIVEALHGSVSVTETPGGGATFRVSFPLAQPRDAAEHAFIQTQPLPITRGRTPSTDAD